MARKVFFSFHYEKDNWRVSQVRNIGKIEENEILLDNKWEEVKKKGDVAIRNWIDTNLKNRSCTIVLVGEETANRKWINYEIKEAWNNGKAVLGIYIHKLKDRWGNQSKKGMNPFDFFTMGETKTKFSSIVKCYNPPFQRSTDVYNYIKKNIEEWVEEAIKIRNLYKL